jgi:hypothetical protein
MNDDAALALLRERLSALRPDRDAKASMAMVDALGEFLVGIGERTAAGLLNRHIDEVTTLVRRITATGDGGTTDEDRRLAALAREFIQLLERTDEAAAPLGELNGQIVFLIELAKLLTRLGYKGRGISLALLAQDLDSFKENRSVGPHLAPLAHAFADAVRENRPADQHRVRHGKGLAAACVTGICEAAGGGKERAIRLVADRVEPYLGQNRSHTGRRALGPAAVKKWCAAENRGQPGFRKGDIERFREVAAENGEEGALDHLEALLKEMIVIPGQVEN